MKYLSRILKLLIAAILLPFFAIWCVIAVISPVIYLAFGPALVIFVMHYIKTGDLFDSVACIFDRLNAFEDFMFNFPYTLFNVILSD